MIQLATVTNPRAMLVRPTEHSRDLADRARFFSRRKSSRLWLPPEVRKGDVAEAAPYAGMYASRQLGKAVFNPLTIFEKYGITNGAWIRLDLGTVLSANLYQTAGSTIGPVVALFGAANSVVNPVVEFQTSGILGASTFRYGPVSGSWTESNVPTSISVALKGPFDGIGLSFPAGSYFNDYVYNGVVAGNPDQTGNGNDFANPDYTTCLFLNTNGQYTGVPAMRSGPDTPSPRRFTVNTTLGAPISGNDVAFSMWTDLKLEGLTLSNMLWQFGLFSTNVKSFMEIQFFNTGQWAMNRSDDAALLRQRTTAIGTATGAWGTQQTVFSGTNAVLTQNGTVIPFTGGNADLNTGVITCSKLTLCGRNGAATSALIDESWDELIFAPQAVSAACQTDMLAYLALGRARFR